MQFLTDDYVIKPFPGGGLDWDELHALYMGPLLAINAIGAWAAGFELLAIVITTLSTAIVIWARFFDRTSVLSESWYLLATHHLALAIADVHGIGPGVL